MMLQRKMETMLIATVRNKKPRQKSNIGPLRFEVVDSVEPSIAIRAATTTTTLS